MLYLGNQGEKRIKLPATDLLTHGVVLGRTGSGKTGLMVATLEEVAKAGASAVIFDPKGDLTNLALSLATPAEFALWAEDNADDAYLNWGEGLAKSGLGYDDVRAWRRKVDVVVYAPGKTFGGGRRLRVFPSFSRPAGKSDMPLKDRVSRDVCAVLTAVGAGADPYDPSIVFLSTAILQQWKKGKPLPVSLWPGILSEPSEGLESFGGMPLKQFYDKRKRLSLARSLIGFLHQNERWLKGDRLDLHEIVKRGRPVLNVLCMRHLNEEERQFFSSLMLNRCVDFMFETGATKELKLLVVLDEARGYLPPAPSRPATKEPLCTLLAQGRAQGVGMLIGTQNPMDLDYKALSNVGTWFVGRLRQRDCARDLLSELRSRGIEIGTVQALPQRGFLLIDRRGDHHLLSVRHVLNYLRGPLGPQELTKLDREEDGRAPFLRRVIRKLFWRELLGI